jgi:hypothetical protein
MVEVLGAEVQPALVSKERSFRSVAFRRRATSFPGPFNHPHHPDLNAQESPPAAPSFLSLISIIGLCSQESSLPHHPRSRSRSPARPSSVRRPSSKELIYAS